MEENAQRERRDKVLYWVGVSLLQALFVVLGAVSLAWLLGIVGPEHPAPLWIIPVALALIAGALLLLPVERRYLALSRRTKTK